MSDMNNWINPEKITESFTWYCFSQLNEEQIETFLTNYRIDMSEHLRDTLKKQNPIPEPEKNDEEQIEKRNNEIEDELLKNDNLYVDTMANSLKFKKDEWKKILSKSSIHSKLADVGIG